MPVVTIDGKQIEVEGGTTILKAAEKLGIEIPIFCYHDGLSVAANCRMCLVEVKGAPKPMPACEVQVRDGMEVLTRSETALRARETTLEFILVNHPVDCPICDCAGECVLQDNYFAHSARPSRINVKKMHKAKAVPVGPNVILDKERCINCTRCVRFLHEVTGSGQLVQVHRGSKTEIAVFPGKQLDDPYSLCTVDLCPVGALTSRDFRFRKRAWWLTSTPSVCPECSRGCSVFVDHENGTVYRVRPRQNPDVNKWWACDEGRLAYRRQAEARVEQGVTALRTESEKAVDAVTAARAGAAELAAIRKQGGNVALVLAASLSLEEAYAALRFAKVFLETDRVFLGTRNGGEADSLLRTADRNANRTGIARLAAAQGITLVPLAQLFADGARWQGILSIGTEYDMVEVPEDAGIEAAVVLAWQHDMLTGKASTLVPIPAHYEKAGHYLNVDGVLQGAEKAVAPPEGAAQVHLLLRKMAEQQQMILGYSNFEDVRSKALEAFAAGEGENA